MTQLLSGVIWISLFGLVGFCFYSPSQMLKRNHHFSANKFVLQNSNTLAKIILSHNYLSQSWLIFGLSKLGNFVMSYTFLSKTVQAIRQYK